MVYILVTNTDWFPSLIRPIDEAIRLTLNCVHMFVNIIHKPFQILFDWVGDYTLNINAKTLKQLKRRLCVRSIKRIDGLPNGSNSLGNILSDFRIE